MRTTVTLDEDVAAQLNAEARRTGKSLKEVLNESLRTALSVQRSHRPDVEVRIGARDLGALRAGLSLDNIGALLEAAASSYSVKSGTH